MAHCHNIAPRRDRRRMLYIGTKLATYLNPHHPSPFTKPLLPLPPPPPAIMLPVASKLIAPQMGYRLSRRETSPPAEDLPNPNSIFGISNIVKASQWAPKKDENLPYKPTTAMYNGPRGVQAHISHLKSSPFSPAPKVTQNHVNKPTTIYSLTATSVTTVKDIGAPPGLDVPRHIREANKAAFRERTNSLDDEWDTGDCLLNTNWSSVSSVGLGLGSGTWRYASNAKAAFPATRSSALSPSIPGYMTFQHENMAYQPQSASYIHRDASFLTPNVYGAYIGAYEHLQKNSNFSYSVYSPPSLVPRFDPFGEEEATWPPSTNSHYAQAVQKRPRSNETTPERASKAPKVTHQAPTRSLFGNSALFKPLAQANTDRALAQFVASEMYAAVVGIDVEDCIASFSQSAAYNFIVAYVLQTIAPLMDDHKTLVHALVIVKKLFKVARIPAEDLAAGTFESACFIRFVLIMALNLAQKNTNDYANHELGHMWAAMLGYTKLPELMKFEILTLQALDYRLDMTPADWTSNFMSFQRHAGLRSIFPLDDSPWGTEMFRVVGILEVIDRESSMKPLESQSFFGTRERATAGRKPQSWDKKQRVALSTLVDAFPLGRKLAWKD
ncbi:hypothetical protein CYLTODRAFT_440444 [Cylindrobasidium torrendii FP15055 ss-10]|uniref:Uncharacterized protein n=1 Tax=Cylindrobasidium torrendii FP15055 ss-10 TaxID=1314674 RepID=A0A0D7BR75_9AGAR|nr:hypothetical protein CYLTODRAFT_440444 [Cylindrobasidium torrendii FP15055 ss-10]